MYEKQVILTIKQHNALYLFHVMREVARGLLGRNEFFVKAVGIGFAAVSNQISRLVMSLLKPARLNGTSRRLKLTRQLAELQFNKNCCRIIMNFESREIIEMLIGIFYFA